MSLFSEVLDATLPSYVVFSVVLGFWSRPPIPARASCSWYSFDISPEITAFSPLFTIYLLKLTHTRAHVHFLLGALWVTVRTPSQHLAVYYSNMYLAL